MRQVTMQVPRAAASEVVDLAAGLGATTLMQTSATDGDGGPTTMLVVTVPNAAVGPLLERSQDLGPVEVSIPSTGVFSFTPPHDRVSEELLDVSSVSAYEVVLAGRQSVGGWVGFVTFAVVAAAIVWLGLTAGTSYLLVAAMLVAPFAAPAMNTAIALASGRPALLRSSVARYVVGIAATAATCAVLTLLLGPDRAPTPLVDVLTLTATTVVLPLSAGVAGASLLAQSEHSSLISGAAVGVLVAASLAPPAGGLGMALALGRIDLATHAGFVVLLQLAGITTTGLIVLWLYGLRPTGGRESGGARGLAIGGGLVALLATVGLVAAQLTLAPSLRRGETERYAVETVVATLEDRAAVDLIDVGARIAAPAGMDARVLVDVVVEAEPGVAQALGGAEGLDDLLTDRLRGELGDVVPHVSVTLADSP